jgi:hypothetical protein
VVEELDVLHFIEVVLGVRDHRKLLFVVEIELKVMVYNKGHVVRVCRLLS